MKRLKVGRCILFQNLSIYKKPFQYFVVAFCGFCVDFLVYALILKSGGSVYFSNFIGFCIGASVNVILLRNFVFVDSKYRLFLDVLFTIIANGSALMLGTVVLWLGVDVFGINMYVMKLVANVFTFVVNYFTRTSFFQGKKDVF